MHHAKRPAPSDDAHNLVAATTRAHARNRRQKILFVCLTVALTLAGLAVARYAIKPANLVFAVAPAGGAEHRFADRLAALAVQNNRHLRIKVVVEETPAQALARFGQGKADLALARTDMRIPQQARALALVEHVALLVGAPKAAKVKSLAALARKRVALVSADPRDAAFIRKFLDAQEIALAGELELRADAPLPALLGPGGPNGIVALMRRSQIVKDKRWEAAAQKPGFDVLAVDGAKALERRLPGAKAESIEAGALASAPRTPPEDVDSMELEELLVVRAKISSALATPLTELVLENREALAEDGVYATAIEAPDVEKDARVLAHKGAADYVNGEVQTVFDRYGDLFYIGTTVASIVGSLCVALYTAFTRVQPVSANQLTQSILDATRDIRKAEDLESVARGEGALDAILEDTLAGLRDGSVSSEGFEGFRLAYERAREIAARQRADFERQTA